MNSRQAARFYEMVMAISPVLVQQSSHEIQNKVAQFRKITLGNLPEKDAIGNEVKPGHPMYDSASQEFGRLCALMVPQELDKCSGSVVTYAEAILKRAGQLVNKRRKTVAEIE